MNGFLYGVALQWKFDIRSKSLLVTCYIVPLIFFLLMGGIFTSVIIYNMATAYRGCIGCIIKSELHMQRSFQTPI